MRPQGHYHVLGLDPGSATPAAVTQAFRRLARTRHPDKPGGDAAAFAALREAYETLCDPARRAVYDLQAFDAPPGRRPGGGPWGGGGEGGDDEQWPPGCEEALLRELSSSGVTCDHRTQLVVLCALCARPATKECWTCGTPICSFCTRRRHARGAVPPHWPLVNTPGRLVELLGRQELERKRLEDGAAHQLDLPGYRPQEVMRAEREFRRAAAQAYGGGAEAAGPGGGAAGNRRRHDPRLAPYYMWDQTEASLHIAVYLPTGCAKQRLDIDCSPAGLSITPSGSPAVVDRAWAHAIAAGTPIDTWITEDGRLLALRVAKASPGQRWRALFAGDSDGARALQPPYRLTEAEEEVLLEAPLPWWVVPGEDVAVELGPRGLAVWVDGCLQLRRSFWPPGEGPAARSAVDVAASSWTVLEERGQAGASRLPGGGGSGGEAVVGAAQPAPPAPGRGRARPGKLLSVSLARWQLTAEELQYKKGVRQDHRAAPRTGMLAAPHERGVRLFACDEDAWGLEDVLQALAFHEVGSAWVPAKPWDPDSCGRLVTRQEQLPQAAAGHLQRLRAAASGGAAAEAAGSGAQLLLTGAEGMSAAAAV